MESQFILPFFLRFVPSIVLLSVAFYAANDKKSRERWTQLLYQAGSLRPDQRDDPKVQGGVKVPFFVLSVIMLFLPAHFGPVSYYIYVTKEPEVVSNLIRRPIQPNSLEEKAKGSDANTEATAPAEPTPAPGLENPPMPGQAPAAPSSPAAGRPRGLAPHARP